MKGAALLLVLATIVACGGSTVGGLGDGGSGSGSGSGGGSSGGSSGGGSGGGGGLVSGCPAQATTGGTCSPQGLQCEYGSDPDLACDVYIVCGATGGWGGASQVSNPKCPSSAPGAGGCPSNMAGVTVGQSCSTNGLDCAYPEARCECTTTVSGPPTTGNPTPTWACEHPATGCPEPRPRLGSPCTTAKSATCDYGSCTLSGGTALQCANGAWTQAAVPCPL